MNNPDYSLPAFEYLPLHEERKQSRQVLFPKVTPYTVKIFFPSLKASLKSADRGVLKISVNRNYIEEGKKRRNDMIYLLDRRMWNVNVFLNGTLL